MGGEEAALKVGPALSEQAPPVTPVTHPENAADHPRMHPTVSECTKPMESTAGTMPPCNVGQQIILLLP